MNEPKKETRPEWILRPKMKHLVLFSTLWMVSFLLLLLAITNLFHESLWMRKNMFVGVILLFSLYRTLQLWQTYFKNRAEERNSAVST